MEIDKKILTMCKTTIAQKLGNIDDLPDELANTLANVFYRSFEFSFKWTESMAMKANQNLQQKKVGADLHASADDISSLANITSYYDKTIENQKLVDGMHKALRSVDIIINLISELRKIDKAVYPDLYNTKVNHILDVMKYRIKDEKTKIPSQGQ